MKKKYTLIILFFMISFGRLDAKSRVYIDLFSVREKVQQALYKMGATFNWVDTSYAQRERIYLMQNALEMIKKQRYHLQNNVKQEEREGYEMLITAVEQIVTHLRDPALTKEQFEQYAGKLDTLFA